jgi:hypothetical protein
MEKSINFTFRGEANYSNGKISLQRNKVIEILRLLEDNNSVIGGKVNKKMYLSELLKSRLSISPFGWGEICFRDFESMLSQSLLLKPNMSHIETYPNFFIENETYIPLRWDLEDTKEKIKDCLENYDKYQYLIKNAYEQFKLHHENDLLFVNHFLNLIELSGV